MDLDQLDLNPRITAAIKRGMYAVESEQRYTCTLCETSCGAPWATSNQRLLSFSFSEGAPLPLSPWRAVTAEG